MKVDLDRVTEILREVGATEIMPYFRHLTDADIEAKSDSSLVTIADKNAERALIVRLQDALPGSLVLGEELYEADPSTLQVLDSDAPVWTIDPIDGTSSFTRGEPTFGIMIALMLRGVAIASWIHDPNSGDTLIAEKGAGTWLRGQKLSMVQNRENSVGLLGSRLRKTVESGVAMPTEGLPRVEYGVCSAFDYPRLLDIQQPFGGRVVSPAQFLAYRYTNPWDHLPGTLIVHEAGGYASNWAGQPYDYRLFKGGLFVCRDKSHSDMLCHRFNGLIEALKA